jgi:ABC-2 type transport system permease protein
MTWLRLVAELRKLTTTKLPWGFVGVLVAISTITGIAVIAGTDADGTKGFIATAEDQRSLMAFAANAMMGAGLFGAIAVAREYSHGTVVPMFLASPKRHRAVLAQLTAILLAGAVLGFVGAGLTVLAGVISLAVIGRDFLLSAGDVTRLMSAAALAGASGAILGAGVGALVRNTGGAVTAAVLLLIILPPLAVQFSATAASWVPSTLASVISGVGREPGLPAALVGLVAWGLIPAVVGVVAVQRRDVV